MTQPHLHPRHLAHERPWLVTGPVRLRHHREGAHVVWYVEDDEGIVALAESREELEHALHEQGHGLPSE